MKELLKGIRDIDLQLKIVQKRESQLILLSQQSMLVEDLQIELNKKLVSISNQKRIKK
tara:strand:- start:812 stop:985 length:174 start_codon:yes stop_codon:yes gene_type:complete